MSIRITLPRLAMLLIPVLLVAVALLVHDGYWIPQGPKHTRPGQPILIGTVACLAGYVASHLDFVRDALSRGFWRGFQYVQSSPGEAAVAVVLLRGLCVLGLWALGLGAIRGAF